ncbi:unnamed protein product [Bemisia tabaci]|uniref:Uncharacterized protein n=1 Tax=Bemisia tabaci TaxID=7038 RepID=A0A9P0F9G1_BEMTA|nr:unnamed protein product [Bemisia tabaci]
MDENKGNHNPAILKEKFPHEHSKVPKVLITRLKIRRARCSDKNRLCSIGLNGGNPVLPNCWIRLCIILRRRQKRCVRARPMEVSVPPSAILDDSSSQGLYIDEGDHDPRSGEVSGNSSTVEDSGLHYSISTSIHPASTSVLPASTSPRDHTNEPREFVASTSKDPAGQRRHPPYSEEVYPSNQVSDFVSMLQAKVERIRNTCEMLNEDELFSCEVIEELKRKRSQKVKREIKMKILGIFNDYDGIGED